MDLVSEAADRAARQAILDALRAAGGDVRTAARALGAPERTLWHRIRRLGLAESVAQIRAEEAARVSGPPAPA